MDDEPDVAVDQHGTPDEPCAGDRIPAIEPAPSEAPPDKPTIAALPEIQDVHDLDWAPIGEAVTRSSDRSRMRATVEGFEALLDRPGGPGLLFDRDRSGAEDQAIKVGELDPAAPLWIIGDLHGDLLALEASLTLIARCAHDEGSPPPNMVLLGDLFDDEGLGLELLLRVFELVLEAPDRICVLVGNHDEALSYDGTRFATSVSPGDFADFLNANLAHEWIERAGKLAVRFFAQAPHALFLPDGLLIAHAGFPLIDLHPHLEANADWNDPACLSDFTWTRAHPTARKKMPNRFTRGSQFGRDDFAAFCELSTRLGRPVTHIVRGHDHAEERFMVYPAYEAHPMLTTVALSRRLPRETFGPYERVPTLARFIPRSLPRLYRLHLPAELVATVFPPPEAPADPAPVECQQ
ncbi:metallophosphoesterase [Sphingomonas sp. LY29]|uniref:metallophosphoesterase n=1 Tax=Sphingomonas sp. LY29 TaxID=3095341 RepID=UPI002D79B311|nr:metallophosphoesterase [Sphingomonas sp. LY29]WRP26405.1 metallophosphoesterase [Sphingomonas sp. LY29]